MPLNSLTFASTLEQIETSEAFKNFKEKNPKIELCAGFFIIDYEQNKNQQQLDYCLADGKIFTFILNPETKEIIIKQAEKIEMQDKKLEKLGKLNPDIKADLDDVEKILSEKLKQKKIDKKLNKTIAILHKSSETNKQIWNLNCMLAGLEILQVQIDTETGEILKFEKKSMFDFIKKQ